MTRVPTFVIAFAGLLLLAACADVPHNPIAPTAALESLLLPSSSGRMATLAAATNGQPLDAALGTGSGIVNVTPTAAVDGSFSAQITVNVHDTAPNTTFYVQRAPEIGRANSSDGICQRALGQTPWGPPTPNFVTFPLPDAALQTSPGGAGSTHIDFDVPTIADGTQFDVMFRLVDSLTNPTNELRTGCFTVSVK